MCFVDGCISCIYTGDIRTYVALGLSFVCVHVCVVVCGLCMQVLLLLLLCVCVYICSVVCVFFIWACLN